MPSEPNYGARHVEPLRGPEVHFVDGEHLSVWDVHLERPADPHVLSALATDIDRRCGAEVALCVAGPLDVELRLRTPNHPLDPEAFPVVDCVFALLHQGLGVTRLNGSERRFWRTFRSRA